MNKHFWKNKRVLITGHTGFKGSWLALWLNLVGAKVQGYSLQPPTDPSLYNILKLDDDIRSHIGDVRDLAELKEVFCNFQPDIVFHLAAQPLVRLSYDEPIETYSTNIMGTMNVFEAVKAIPSIKAVVNITSDKCYENKEWLWGYRENEPMGGYDPYSSSKGCAELVTSAYRRSFFNDKCKTNLASARAGNVIGGGDWAQDRLIPDIINAFSDKQPVVIRNPQAVRPWQHVLEPLYGYLLLAEKLYQQGSKCAEGWNFGPNDEDAKPVEWVVAKIADLWGQNASWTLDKSYNVHEAHYLKLDCSKAKQELSWSPKWELETALEKVIDWHQSYLNNGNIKAKTLEQITEYMTTS